MRKILTLLLIVALSLGLPSRMGMAALELVATTSYVNPPDSFDALSEGTLMGWFYLTSVGSGNYHQILTSKYPDGTTRNWIAFNVRDDDHLTFDTAFPADPGPSYPLKVNKNATLDINTWYHGAFTVKTGENALYLDGVPGDVTYTYGDATTRIFFSDLPSGQDTYIGVFLYSGTLYIQSDEIVADVRIYNRALSAAEILTIFNAKGSDNIVNGLVGRWLQDELPDGTAATVASSVIDVSKEGEHATPVGSPVYRAAPMRLINNAGGN